MDISQLGASALGSAVATTLVAAGFKARFDRQLESQKALLQRASAVHERQVIALVELYAALYEAEEYLQLMMKSVIFEGEKPEEYPTLFAAAATTAYTRFVATRLLLPPAFADSCDGFFKALQEGQGSYGFFKHPMMQGDQRADQWERACHIAYKELPALLATLEFAARDIIHGTGPIGSNQMQVISQAS